MCMALRIGMAGKRKFKLICNRLVKRLKRCRISIIFIETEPKSSVLLKQSANALLCRNSVYLMDAENASLLAAH